MSLNYTTKPRQDTVINATGIIFNDIENLIMYLKVNVQKDKWDEDFRRPFFSTVVDVKKLLTGTYGNYIAATLMDGIKKSTDFELKFPFKKVTKFHVTTYSYYSQFYFRELIISMNFQSLTNIFHRCPSTLV